MPEINALEPVSLRQVWPDEARAGRVDIIAQQVSTMAKVVIENFTPWLADHLHLLGAELNLEAVGQWIADNLLRLRAVVQPYLDQPTYLSFVDPTPGRVMEDVATSSDDEEDAE